MTDSAVPQGPTDPLLMSVAQRARRQRLVDAVVALVREGRDEDLSMKEIADRAGVALGTVYRYFSSKDHLVAAALLEWARQLERRTARHPLPHGTPNERVQLVLARALRAYQRHPAFARLLVMVTHSTDPHASACYQEMGVVVFGTLGRALDELDDEHRENVLRVIGAVWYHCLVEWVNGRLTAPAVSETLATTVALLLPDEPDAVRATA